MIFCYLAEKTVMVNYYIKILLILLLLIVLLPSCTILIQKMPQGEISRSLASSDSGSCLDLLSDLIKITPDDVSAKEIKESGLSPSQLSYSKLFPLNGRTLDPIEDVLKNSEIIEVSGLGGGSNFTSILTFKDGIQGVWKPHIKKWTSNYRTSVLAYEIDRRFGINLVPPTVERVIDGRKGSVQLFMKSGDKDNIPKSDLEKQSFFDFIIDYRDRHGDNFLASPEGNIITIDNDLSFTGFGYHGRSFFRRRKDIAAFLKSEEAKKIIDKFKRIDYDSFETEARGYLGQDDANKLIRRIKVIIKYAERFQ